MCDVPVNTCIKCVFTLIFAVFFSLIFFNFLKLSLNNNHLRNDNFLWCGILFWWMYLLHVWQMYSSLSLLVLPNSTVLLQIMIMLVCCWLFVHCACTTTDHMMYTHQQVLIELADGSEKPTVLWYCT